VLPLYHHQDRFALRYDEDRARRAAADGCGRATKPAEPAPASVPTDHHELAPLARGVIDDSGGRASGGYGQSYRYRIVAPERTRAPQPAAEAPIPVEARELELPTGYGRYWRWRLRDAQDPHLTVPLACESQRCGECARRRRRPVVRHQNVSIHRRPPDRLCRYPPLSRRRSDRASRCAASPAPRSR